MSFRTNKVASLIKEQLSMVFLHKIQDPELGLLTITNVLLTPDLKLAKVYLSVYEKEKREDILLKVNEIKPMIRTALAQRVNLRNVPELNFYIDDTQDYVDKMEGLFKRIHDDNKQNQ